MKTYKYIALAALAFTFAACSQVDDFTPQGDQKDTPITIASAAVGEPATRVITDDNKLEGIMNEESAHMGVLTKLFPNSE